MKRSLRNTGLSLLTLFGTTALSAQVSLVPDQNPSFAVSRDKYMRAADSLTRTEATTLQDTYHAYDWYEAREERRKERREWRQALALEQARYTYPYYYQSPYQQPYRHRYTGNRGYFHICLF
jgi:hypothetical protein